MDYTVDPTPLSPKERTFSFSDFQYSHFYSETHTWTWQEGDYNISSGYLWLVRFQMIFFFMFLYFIHFYSGHAL